MLGPNPNAQCCAGHPLKGSLIWHIWGHREGQVPNPSSRQPLLGHVTQPLREESSGPSLFHYWLHSFSSTLKSCEYPLELLFSAWLGPFVTWVAPPVTLTYNSVNTAEVHSRMDSHMCLCPHDHQMKRWNISAPQKVSCAPFQSTPPLEVTGGLSSITIHSF